MQRVGGYAPISSYAAIGDGRTVGLVAGDGAIDWLALPELDAPSVFGAVLDADRGGRFALAPDVPYAVARRYLPDTNVLETVFSTDGGAVRVSDAMTLSTGSLGPLREVARRVEGLAGSVPMSWSIEPRFGYAGVTTRLGWRAGVPVATAGGDALAVRVFDAGAPHVTAGAVVGRFEAREGTRAVLALCSAHGEPLVMPTRHEVESRLDAAATTWRRWSDGLTYKGPWRDAVIRSALVLKLLVHAPSGALAAAATTSLPEQIGGERNWDYRFSWVRDSAFMLNALLGLSCAPEARAYFWWLMHASQLTHPRLRVLYRLDGGARARARAGARRLSRIASRAGRQRGGRPATARHLRRAAAWLAGIVINLLTYSGFYDIALRDFGLMLAALTLARLASVYDPPLGYGAAGRWRERSRSGR